MERGYFGGVDVGGSKVRVLIADHAGAIIARDEKPLRPQEGFFKQWRDGTAYYGIATQIEQMFGRLLDSANISTHTAIGIGSAGPLQDGAVINSPNTNLPPMPAGFPREPIYLPLTEPLQDAFSTSIRLENDLQYRRAGRGHLRGGEEDRGQERSAPGIRHAEHRARGGGIDRRTPPSREGRERGRDRAHPRQRGRAPLRMRKRWLCRGLLLGERDREQCQNPVARGEAPRETPFDQTGNGRVYTRWPDSR